MQWLGCIAESDYKHPIFPVCSVLSRHQLHHVLGFCHFLWNESPGLSTKPSLQKPVARRPREYRFSDSHPFAHALQGVPASRVHTHTRTPRQGGPVCPGMFMRSLCPRARSFSVPGCFCQAREIGKFRFSSYCSQYSHTHTDKTSMCVGARAASLCLCVCVCGR